jgi:hypothetical protein
LKSGSMWEAQGTASIGIDFDSDIDRDPDLDPD